MNKERKIDWITTSFLIGTPLISLFLIPLFFYLEKWNWSYLLLLIGFWTLSAMSITGGYHRLIAHRSYKARTWLKVFYLFFGAGAFEGPAIKWATDHRRHHRKVDTNEDPYNINNGFWFAHIGWLFFNEEEKYKEKFEPDLLNDKWIKFQYNHYVWLAIVSGFVLPTIIGYFLGSPFGGFLFGGLLRILVCHHCTFFINSLCHIWGTQPYNPNNSARDNFFLALVTYGEGYHNFHHYFEGDYRNGIRWFQWDPTKWTIKLLSFTNQTFDLKRAPSNEILKARMKQQEQILLSRGVSRQKIEALKAKVEEAQKRLKELSKEYQLVKKNWKAQSEAKLLEIQTDLKLAKKEFKSQLKQWKIFVRSFQSLPAMT